MTSPDFDKLETLAQRICAEHGRDWGAKGCKRNHWRRLACDQEAKLYRIVGKSGADALMEIFGYVRVMP